MDLSRQVRIGVEELMRWACPTCRLASPGAFIAGGKNIGVDRSDRALVLRNACQYVAKWRPDKRSLLNLARQFLDPDLYGQVTDAINAAGVRPDYLEIELTETLASIDMIKLRGRSLNSAISA